jgi:L-serine dehydratase
MVHSLFSGMPERVVVKFCGSFAHTWHGHGSDKAIIAGILGFMPDDERIRESLAYGKQAGLDFRFEAVDLPFAHPNTIIVTAEAAGITEEVCGESVGGGNIIIRRINDIELKFDGCYDTLLINHIDKNGIIAYVAGVIEHEEINISQMMVYRSRKSSDAIMVIEIDGTLDKRLESVFESSKQINRARVISKLQ